MIRRQVAWLGILVVLPFLGGVKNCNQPVDPSTSGEQTPADTGQAPETGDPADASGATGEEAGAASEEGTAGEEGVVVAPQVSTEELAQGMFNEGLLALSMRPPQVPTAIDRFDQVTQMMPDWAEGHYNLGLAYLEGRNPTKAIKALEQATRLQPELGDAWVALGQAYQSENRVGAAMDAYSQCVRHDPENTECMLGSVRYSFDQGESPASIISRIQDILTINSTSVGAYVLLSLTYERQGEHKLAQFALLKAQQANEAATRDPIVHCNMGMLYREMGEEYEAEEAFKRALELDPNHVQTLVNLANIKVANLDFEGAKLLVQRAVIQDKHHVGARLALGIAKRGTGDLDGAKTEFETVLNEDPANTDAMYNLAVLYGDHYRDFDKAIDAYNELIRNTPGLTEDDPLFVYLEEATKNKDREERRLEREQRKRERDEKRRADEAAEAEEEARRAAEEAAARAAAAMGGGATGTETGTGTETETETETETGTEAETGTETEAGTEAGTETEAEGLPTEVDPGAGEGGGG